MAEYKLSYTASEIDEALGKVDRLVSSVNGVSPDSSGNVTIEVSGGSGSQVQADWNQNDSSAPDYIKNRPFHKEMETLFEQDVDLIANAQLGDLLASSDNYALDYIPETLQLGDLFNITLDNKTYECAIKIEEYYMQTPYLGNIYIYFKLMCDMYGYTEEQVYEALGIPVGSIKDTGEPFLLIIDAETFEFGFMVKDMTAGTYPCKIEYSNIKKLSSAYIDWDGGNAPSGLPEVTSNDNNKVLMVVDGKWAVASITDGDEVAY